MEGELRFEIVQEGDAYVARCLDVEVASDGATENEAIAALQEAMELYFEDCSNAQSLWRVRLYRRPLIV